LPLDEASNIIGTGTSRGLYQLPQSLLRCSAVPESQSLFRRGSYGYISVRFASAIGRWMRGEVKVRRAFQLKD